MANTLSKELTVNGIKVQTTEDYFKERFNLSVEELSEERGYGYRREDNLILDDALEVRFYMKIEDLQERIPYWLTEYKDYEVKAILQLTEANENNFALLLN